MSEYYKQIDFSKYSYSVPDSLKEFADRELTEKELKELDLIPSGVKDIARATLGVGKAALDISGDKDKDKKDKEAEKQKKLDFKQYAKFLKNGFKNYADQYFVHPVIYYNEKERQVGYTVLSMVTDSTITLQPYKLANNDLYKLSIQKLPGKITNIIQKVFGFPYKRIKYERMTVSNVSTSKDPVGDFKMDQIFKQPVYKELNKYNPKRGEKYTCSLIFYDDSKRKLVIGQNISIIQVTQDIITLGKIFQKKDAKGKDIKFLKTHEISLSMLIPSYAVISDASKKKMESNNPFYYKHIFPITTSSSEEYQKFSEASNKELVLFYVRPFLVVKELDKDLESFNAYMETFNFDNYKGYISSLSSLIYGEPDKTSKGTPKLPKIPLSKLRTFMRKHSRTIKLYGWTPKLRAILLRYARLTPGYSVYDLNNKNILREEEVSYSVEKEQLKNLTTDNKLPILDLKYIDEEDSSDPDNPYFVFKILRKSGDTSNIQNRKINDTIKILSSYFEHIESIKTQDNSEMGIAFIDNTYFEQTSDSSSQNDESAEEEIQEEEEPINNFSDNRDMPPTSASTTPDSVDEIILEKYQIDLTVPSPEIISKIKKLVNNIKNEENSEREIKILTIFQKILQIAIKRETVDVIELKEIEDIDAFSSRIQNITKIDELGDLVVKKEEVNMLSFNINNSTTYLTFDKFSINRDNILGFSVIEDRLKIFVKQGTISVIEQQSNRQNNNNSLNEVTYYTLVPDGNNVLKNPQSSKPENKIYTVKITTSDNKTGKVSINLNNKALSFPDTYIKPFCDVTNSAQFKTKTLQGIRLISEGEAKFENGNWILTKKPVVEYE